MGGGGQYWPVGEFNPTNKHPTLANPNSSIHTQPMDVVKVLHMIEGNGEISYARNSALQSKLISLAKPSVEEAVRGMVNGLLHQEDKRLLAIADLGCSSGPNTLIVVSEIVDILRSECQTMGRPLPELSVYLNDLPSNDFNNILGSLLPQFERLLKGENGTPQLGCFVSATAGSFYGRLFPTNSLHFVHSSSCLHWLSQVPAALENGAVVNKGQLYLTKTSPMPVVEAYTRQFQHDFSLFLRSRAVELVPGGRAVLSLLGRTSDIGPTGEAGSDQWELLARALESMVVDGVVDQGKIDSFSFPYYVPSVDELKEEVRKEGSFYVDRTEAFEVDWHEGMVAGETKGERVATTIRAVVQSMIESHFGGGICDELFKRYAVVLDEHSSKKRLMFINLVVSLVKKD